MPERGHEEHCSRTVLQCGWSDHSINHHVCLQRCRWTSSNLVLVEPPYFLEGESLTRKVMVIQLVERDDRSFRKMTRDDFQAFFWSARTGRNRNTPAQ